MIKSYAKGISMKRIRFLTVLAISMIVLIFNLYGFTEANKMENPENTVKAFIKARGDFSYIDNNPNYCKKIVSFIDNGNKYLYSYGGGGVKVIGGFKIIGKKVNKNSAEVIVKHYFCGGCANDGSCESKFSEETGIYKLINKNNQWKLTKWYDLEEFPCDGWMSVDKAIKMLEYAIRTPEYAYLKKESIKALKDFKNCKKRIKNIVGGD